MMTSFGLRFAKRYALGYMLHGAGYPCPTYDGVLALGLCALGRNRKPHVFAVGSSRLNVPPDTENTDDITLRFPSCTRVF